MTPKQEARIRQHGEQLNAIFHTGLDPVTLCKKLRRIEGAAHKLAEDACNHLSMEDQEFKDRYTLIVRRLLGVIPKIHGFHFNLDPRGYALKIDAEYMRAHKLQLHTDMGGYGILAPEFDKEGR